MVRRLRNQTIEDGLNTDGANDFAKDTYNSPEDVWLNWWELFSNYRMKRWKQELKNLCEKTGISLNDVCDYIDIAYSGLPGFYRKLPKLRETYIGIGMAYKLPLKTINRWLIKYGGKKQLYIKDVFNDLVWIYLINANLRDSDSGNNYYRKFDECRNSIKEIYNHMNEEITEDDDATADLDNDIKSIVFDPDYAELKKFVRENMTAFHSAYAKPKKILNSYIENILRVKNEHKDGKRNLTLNSLRGYLDDSMINYLTSGKKYVPKNKKTHISIGLALGMTIKDLDTYLKMLGYAPLDGTCLEEGLLINALEKWEGEHPLQRKFKEKYFDGNDEIKLGKQDEKQAVNDMLGLRNDLKEIYEAFPKSAYNKETTTKFPYMNE